mgnify:CR=1 FL=1
MNINRVISSTIVLALFSIAMPASAFEIFGMRFFENAASETTVQNPVYYSLDFNSPDVSTELAATLHAASDLWLEQDAPTEGSASLIAMANSDYRSILAALYGAGYYAPEISITLNGQQASEVAFTQDLASVITVEITIDAGPEFRFGNVDLAPLAPITTERRDFVEAPDTVGLQSGAPALSGIVGTAKDLAVEAWRQQGYPLATIAERSIVADHSDQTLDVALQIDPGSQATYGPILVSGNERMDADFVRYMAKLPETTEFDPDDLDAARARLVQLQVFSSIRIEEAEVLTSDSALPITLHLNEQPLRRIGLGATFSSIDGLGVEAYWIHRNLFGRAERLRFEASLNGIESADGLDGLDGADYAVGLRFTKPGVIVPDVNFIAAAGAEHVQNDEIERDAASVDFGLEYTQGDLAAGLSIFGTYTETQDDLGFRQFRFVGLKADATFDKRDDKLDPSGGYYLEATVSPMREFVFGNTGVRSTVEGRGYYGFGEDDRFVLSGRARVGSLYGFPVSEAPADMLFFSGGGNSVRGFGFESIGITTGTVFTGGLSTINLSAEIRTKVTDTIGVVGFIDAGTVGPNALPDPAGEWRSGFGVGLRYQAGLGPLRLDLARGMDLQAGDPEYAIYLGLGQAF